jgi:hypothetical protein
MSICGCIFYKACTISTILNVPSFKTIPHMCIWIYISYIYPCIYVAICVLVTVGLPYPWILKNIQRKKCICIEHVQTFFSSWLPKQYNCVHSTAGLGVLDSPEMTHSTWAVCTGYVLILFLPLLSARITGSPCPVTMPFYVRDLSICRWSWNPFPGNTEGWLYIYMLTFVCVWY